MEDLGEKWKLKFKGEEYMKKILISGILMMMVGMLAAQTVQENAAAVVYYMPKTELVITLDYTVTHQEPGVFYQYAKRYLGAEDVITEARSMYTLTGVRCESEAWADLSRAYQVSPQKGLRVQKLSLTADGRLRGYNIGADVCPMLQDEIPSCAAQAQESVALMPLLEEHFMAGTTAKMAEGAAKQIYHIREMRLNMLVGDVEHVPTDGKAMELVLAELEQREQALVALFIGTNRVEKCQKQIRYMPKKSVDGEVICRFSQHSGVVSSDDLSGSPVRLHLKASKPTLRRGEGQDRKGIMLSQLYYNLPGHAEVAIMYNGQEMCTARYTVAQFGVAIPLAQEMFLSKDGPVIHINPETGNIQSIQQ